MRMKIICFALIGSISIQCQTQKGKDTQRTSTATGDDLKTAEQQTTAIQEAAEDYAESTTCADQMLLSCQAAIVIAKPENEEQIKDAVTNMSQDDVQTVQEAGAKGSYSNLQRWGGFTLMLAGLASLGGSAYGGYRGYKAWVALKRTMKLVTNPTDLTRDLEIKKFLASRNVIIDEYDIEKWIDKIETLKASFDGVTDTRIKEINGEFLRTELANVPISERANFHSTLYAYVYVSADDQLLAKTSGIQEGMTRTETGNFQKISALGTNGTLLELERTNAQQYANHRNLDVDMKQWKHATNKQRLADPYKFSEKNLETEHKIQIDKLKTKKYAGIGQAIVGGLIGVIATGVGAAAFGTSFSLAENSDTDASRFLNRLNQIMDAILATR